MLYDTQRLYDAQSVLCSEPCGCMCDGRAGPGSLGMLALAWRVSGKSCVHVRSCLCVVCLHACTRMSVSLFGSWWLAVRCRSGRKVLTKSVMSYTTSAMCAPAMSEASNHTQTLSSATIFFAHRNELPVTTAHRSDSTRFVCSKPAKGGATGARSGSIAGQDRGTSLGRQCPRSPA